MTAEVHHGKCNAKWLLVKIVRERRCLTLQSKTWIHITWLISRIISESVCFWPFKDLHLFGYDVSTYVIICLWMHWYSLVPEYISFHLLSVWNHEIYGRVIHLYIVIVSGRNSNFRFWYLQKLHASLKSRFGTTISSIWTHQRSTAAISPLLEKWHVYTLRNREPGLLPFNSIHHRYYRADSQVLSFFFYITAAAFFPHSVPLTPNPPAS